MLKRKIKSRLIRKKLIFISIIASLSIMGVGYSAWNDGTTMTASLTTGFINPIFSPNEYGNKIKTFNDEQLDFKLSDDNCTLYIEGEVYPGFEKDIDIIITDAGPTPTEYIDYEKHTEDDISKLNKYDSNRRSSRNTNNNIEVFKLNINTNSLNDKTRQVNKIVSEQNDEISKLEQRIKELESEIKLYEEEKSYKFEYILKFKQSVGSGTWKKDLTIKSNIDIAQPGSLR